NKKKLAKPTVIIDNTDDTLNSKCKLDFKNAKTLTRLILENELKYDWLYVKSKVNTIFENEDKTFDAKVRLRKDSLMLVTIELLSINFAKILITTDSIKMVDYYHKKYFVGDYNYLNKLFNADLDFNVIQSVIIGNSAEFFHEDEKLKPVTDRKECRYKLSTIRKHKIKRIESGKENPKKALQIISLDPNTFKIFENEFYDPSTERKFIAKYSDFKEKDSIYAPYLVDIEVKAEKEMKIKIDYVRITINEPQKFHFRIPSKYDPIEFKQE
ncbi:MAG: DUF4292 domain-containing protein, partial [Flavobacteriales bacterium]|nr:DUF4292 domain-containing protein [Flavobacteriales bacterium]